MRGVLEPSDTVSHLLDNADFVRGNGVCPHVVEFELITILCERSTGEQSRTLGPRLTVPFSSGHEDRRCVAEFVLESEAHRSSSWRVEVYFMTVIMAVAVQGSTGRWRASLAHLPLFFWRISNVDFSSVY